MDPLTKKVQGMYMEYPFPDEDYKMAYGLLMLRYFKKISPEGKRSFLDGIQILDAGCGTGSVTAGLATQFPTSQITSVDLTPASLELAKKKAAQKGCDNITFQQANLLELDLKKTFDAIFCIGVLHHLSDPLTGLKCLAKHLKPGGRMLLWLYGKHGRYRLNLNQRMFSILLGGVDSLSEKVALVKEALRCGPQGMLSCHFNVADSDIEDDWERSRDWVLDKDPWIVDQFLHYNELVVDIEDTLDLADGAGLELESWLGVEQDIGRYIDNETIKKEFQKLPQRDRLVALDMLVKPNYYTVVLKKKEG